MQISCAVLSAFCVVFVVTMTSLVLTTTKLTLLLAIVGITPSSVMNIRGAWYGSNHDGSLWC